MVLLYWITKLIMAKLHSPVSHRSMTVYKDKDKEKVNLQINLLLFTYCLSVIKSMIIVFLGIIILINTIYR